MDMSVCVHVCVYVCLCVYVCVCACEYAQMCPCINLWCHFSSTIHPHFKTGFPIDLEFTK